MRDTGVAGVDIPEGATAMAMTGAASRGPRIFDDPDRFDAERPSARRHIAFHFFPGARLARAEAYVSFEWLLDRLDGFRPTNTEALSHAPSLLIRGVNDYLCASGCARRTRSIASGRGEAGVSSEGGV